MNPPTSAGTPVGAMGPPSRPIDKPTDMNELTDVLLGSGVDLKEEEAALVNRYNNSSQPQVNTLFPSNPATFFNSSGLQASNAGTYSVGHNFNTLSQNVPGDRSSFYGAGTFNQPATHYQSAEDIAEEERKKALRRKNEIRQYHLNGPFLMAPTVIRHINKHAQSMQVTVPQHGLYSNPHSQRVQEVVVSGPDKNEVMVALKNQDLLYLDSPLVELLTLLSLATEERMRTLVEDSATLAKGRRIGSHGVVPSDLVDLAIGNGTAESVNALPTPGNSAVSPKSNPLKRMPYVSHIVQSSTHLDIGSYSESNKLPTPISEGPKTPTSTIAFPNQIAQILRKISQAERVAEEARLAKRARRKASASLSVEGGRADSASVGASTPGTPSGLLGERAPDVEVKKSITKKEAKRQADAKATEAQQHAATNKTMNMALGFGGGSLFGGKKISWLAGKGDQSGSNGFPVPPRVNTSNKGDSRSSALASSSGTGGQLPSGRRKFGDFREDKETGAGIQLRDLVSVLETDGKAKKGLARAYSKLGLRD